ncbi:MAG: tRNA uridine-5-carboxymethylaminomethyl(34) synthesis GTPase MnmE [Wenzhouxiangella sp.]|nr:tRNA uridine-5-carboxymethylaminomethyl(34) synthesis GTPase MnmE [Wenzhouxiangella sp.]
MNKAADTICAVATPPGRGGIGVIRISGPDSFTLAAQLSKGRTLPAPGRFGLRRLYDNDGELIDSGLILCFAAPASFTGEDVVEIQGHGSPLVLELILRQLVSMGARRAGPGEFSERAFLNDRLDLAQAEAIADLIAASSEQAARAATRSLEGRFSAEVTALAEDLTALRVWVEAALDFPDEEVDFLADGEVLKRARRLQQRLLALTQRAEAGRVLTDGLRVAIVGKPNAGKSSLLNALSRRETAIVTDIPGTTRDVLRETVSIAGLPITLADTAGLRQTSDSIEREGVRRAEHEMRQADLLFWVVDVRDQSSQPPPGMPADLPRIEIYNKIDLVDEPARRDGDRVYLSLRPSRGLDLLEQAVLERVGLNQPGEGEFSARQRHVEALQAALAQLQGGIEAMMVSQSGELLAEALRQAADHLGEITGKITADELLGKIFSSFCIGK